MARPATHYSASTQQSDTQQLLERKLVPLLLSEVNLSGCARRAASGDAAGTAGEGGGAARDSLTVLQWNMLADGLAQHGDFVRSPPQALEWERRSELLLQEMRRADADLVCVQECNHYEDFLDPSLGELGYRGLFLPKGTSPCQQYGFPADGCALFYKEGRLRLLQPAQGMHYQDVHQGQPKGNQCLLSAYLEHLPTGNLLLAVCTHLKAKGGAANDLIREHQVQQLLEFVSLELKSRELNLTRTELGPLTTAPSGVNSSDADGVGSDANDGSSNHARDGGTSNGSARARMCDVVICGDFNATPTSLACQALRNHAMGMGSLWDRQPAHDRTDDRAGESTPLPSPLPRDDVGQGAEPRCPAPGTVSCNGSGGGAPSSLQQQQQQQAQQQGGDGSNGSGGGAPSSLQQQQQQVQQQGGDGSNGSSGGASSSLQQQQHAQQQGGDGSNGSGGAASSSQQQQQQQQQGGNTSNGSGGGALPSQQQEQQQAQQPGGAVLLGSSLSAPPPPASPPDLFTTWKFRSGGEKRQIIDYVWYSERGLLPLRRWSMPGTQEIGPQGLPCLRYPSDHLAVYAEFGWLPNDRDGGNRGCSSGGSDGGGQA